MKPEKCQSIEDGICRLPMGTCVQCIPTSGKWALLDQTKPEVEQICIVYYEDGRQEIDKWTNFGGDGAYGKDFCGNGVTGIITHWMPTAEPPIKK